MYNPSNESIVYEVVPVFNLNTQSKIEIKITFVIYYIILDNITNSNKTKNKYTVILKGGHDGNYISSKIKRDITLNK